MVQGLVRLLFQDRDDDDAFDGADDEMFAYLETCIGSTRACRIDAIDCVCLACPPEAGMHMRWTDHACNMINNFVCVCVPDNMRMLAVVLFHHTF